MIPIYRMAEIHIEITNGCNLECSNCTRHIGHHKKIFKMDLETIRKAVLSLTTPVPPDFPNGFPGTIGIMGGEPTTHPRFAEICEIFQELIPDKHKRQLWTDGWGWEKYKTVIGRTFDPDNIIYNSHQDKDVGTHQPLLVAAEDAVADKELMWRLIGNCWVQWRWSASITPKGAFFCEVAASLDWLFNGPGGYPVEPGWWVREPNEFMDQVERSCAKCGGAVPMQGESAHADYDLVSPSNLKRLQDAGSPRIKRGAYKLFDKVFTTEEIRERIKKGWAPYSHRPYRVDGNLVRF